MEIVRLCLCFLSLVTVSPATCSPVALCMSSPRTHLDHSSLVNMPRCWLFCLIRGQWRRRPAALWHVVLGFSHLLCLHVALDWCGWSWLFVLVVWFPLRKFKQPKDNRAAPWASLYKLDLHNSITTSRALFSLRPSKHKFMPLLRTTTWHSVVGSVAPDLVRIREVRNDWSPRSKAHKCLLAQISLKDEWSIYLS